MANQTTDGEQERTVGKRTYEIFLRTIRANLGSPQPPMAAKYSVSICLCSYKRPAKAFYNSVFVGREQKDDIVEWTDADGRDFLALKMSAYDKIDGIYPYSEEDINAIEEIIQVETSRDDTDKEIIGWANTQLLKIESLYGDEGES